jgi:hypothetical protein
MRGADKFTSHGVAWTKDGFLAALTRDVDRRLAVRLFDLNDRIPASYCWYGSRPAGAVFLHPGGLKYSPLRVLANDGVLIGQGTWTTYRDVRNHEGFAEIAGFLGQDHWSSPARFIVAEFDLDALWDMALRCAAEINDSTLAVDMARSPRSAAFDDDLLQLINRAVTAGQVIYTLGKARPNRIISIDREGLFVETEKSVAEGRGPQLVPAWMVSTAWQYLVEHGRLSQAELLDGLNVKRSAFVCALLSHFPGVVVGGGDKVEVHFEGHATPGLGETREPGYQALRDAESQRTQSAASVRDDSGSWPGAANYAARLNQLFEKSLTDDGAPHTSEEVASALQADGIAVHSDSIVRLRAGTGGRPPDRLSFALTFFFDVDPDYFFDGVEHEIAEADAAITATAEADTGADDSHSGLRAREDVAEFLLSQAQFVRILAGLTQAASRCLQAEPVDHQLANRLALIVCDASPLMMEAMSGEVIVSVGMAERMMDTWRETDLQVDGAESEYLWAAGIFRSS